MNIRKRKYYIIVILFSLLFVGWFFLSKGVQSLFYYPHNINNGVLPSDQGYKYEVVQFPSQDGTQLSAWFVYANKTDDKRQEQGTVIFVHGNAANLTAHWQQVSWLPALGYNVFIFDYRGFGASKGKPTPKGVFEDTQSAIDYVRYHPKVNAHQLLVLGQSLGGNNAIAAVGAGNMDGICAMAIDSTFFSYSSIANSIFPGAGFFTNDDYSAEHYVNALSPLPLLFIHGTSDRIVPYEHGQRLYNFAQNPNKQFITIPDGAHISTFARNHRGKYNKLVDTFFQQALMRCFAHN